MIEAYETDIEEISEPWRLPRGWEWVPLMELCTEVGGGGTPSRNHEEYFGGNIVWITPSDLDIDSPNQEVSDSQITLTSAGLEASSAKLMPTGTVLFSSRATIGKIAIAGTSLCTNQGFVNFICKQEHLNNHYLAWCLRCLTEEIKNLANPTTYLEVSRGSLRHFKIPVPFPKSPLRSLDTQHRIVSRIEAFLADLKEASKTLDQMQRDMSQVMEAVLKEVLEELDGNYSSVTIENLISNQVVQLFSGGTPPTDNSKYWNGPVPWVSPKDMKRWYIADSQDHVSPIAIEENKVKLIPRYSLLVVVRGMILARDFPIAIALSDVTINQDMKALYCKDEFLPEYIGYILRARSPHVLQQVKSSAHGTRRIETEILEQIPIPTVPKEVQMRVIAHLDVAQSELNTMQKTLQHNGELLKQVEQSILSEAFRGVL